MDYESINDIFLRHYAKLRERFSESRFLHKIDDGWRERGVDYFSHFLIDKARDMAWEKAQRIKAFERLGQTETAGTSRPTSIASSATWPSSFSCVGSSRRDSLRGRRRNCRSGFRHQTG